MSLILKIIISVAVAAVATGATTYFTGESHAPVTLFIAFCGATFATALLVSFPVGGAATATPPNKQQARRSPGKATDKTSHPAAAGGGAREQGTVKWFNVSKGFGFITKDDGEEIFVHFRSIRGTGRRGLRDGQAVSFVVADSDKGPQAEDVEGLE